MAHIISSGAGSSSMLGSGFPVDEGDEGTGKEDHSGSHSSNNNYSLYNNNNNNNLTRRRQQKQQKLSQVTYTSKNFAFFACISILSIILLVCVTGTSSLNCYHCSSADNPGCDEAFTGRANITDTDCSKHINQPAKVCRKIVQYIEQKKVVIRSCGYIDEHEEKNRKPQCYKRSGTFAIMMESCNCYEDNCNHSASLVPNKSVLLALILISCSSLILYNYNNLQQQKLIKSQR